MRAIGVIADAHANLPATAASLDLLQRRECDLIVHVGDAIGIGPHPAEVLCLLPERHVCCLMGSHDELLALGLPAERPAWMTGGEERHRRWVHAQLSAAHREAVRAWPQARPLDVRCHAVTFLRYARRPDGTFDDLAEPSAAGFADLYGTTPGGVVVFGHDHRAFDLSSGGRRLVSPGSLGCNDSAQARALLLTVVADGGVEMEQVVAGYGDADLLADFDRRGGPDRGFIRRTFLPRPELDGHKGSAGVSA
jgi:predicted phosphodiesterase